MSKPKKPSKNNKTDDIELLRNDVASFASSLGLSSSLPSSGFNDSDFRKKGPLNKSSESQNHQNTPKTKSSQNAKNQDFDNTQKPKVAKSAKNRNFDNTQKPNFGENAKNQSFADSQMRKSTKPVPKPPVLSLDDEKPKKYEKFKNLPKLPLVKASALGVWYVDAAELEGRVIGEGKKPEVRDLEGWKRFVEKKRELGERLMAQYVVDYESTRGQSGDIKMLVTTQRSGTAADKVSAFSVMVGDNPVANMRSLDALLGKGVWIGFLRMWRNVLCLVWSFM